MTSSIKGTGQGFFSAEGALKSKSELATEEKISKKVDDGAAVVEESFGEKTSSAFQKVESRFLEKANQALSITSETEAQLKEVRKVINKEIDAAQELKSAIKNNDQDAEDKARKKLSLAQEERKLVEEKVDQFNKDKVLERRVNLNLGNEQRSKIEVKEISLSKEEIQSDADKAKEVQKYIDSLKEEKNSINAQIKEVKGTKEEVGKTIQRVKSDLNSLQKNTISSYEEAAKVADKIAGSIKEGGLELVQSTVSSKLTPEMLAKLL